MLHVEFKHRSNSLVVTFEDAGDVNTILAVSLYCFIYNVKFSFECIRTLLKNLITTDVVGQPLIALVLETLPEGLQPLLCSKDFKYLISV